MRPRVQRGQVGKEVVEEVGEEVVEEVGVIPPARKTTAIRRIRPFDM